MVTITVYGNHQRQCPVRGTFACFGTGRHGITPVDILDSIILQLLSNVGSLNSGYRIQRLENRS
jgi:hypothetical protein